MSGIWRTMDEEIALQPMPREFQNLFVHALCNDCSAKTKTKYHFIGIKCGGCGGYNTATLQTLHDPNSNDTYGN